GGLGTWADRYRGGELGEGAQLRRSPCAAGRPPEALLRDPHLAERGFFVPSEHPELPATVPYPAAPFRLADAPWRIARRPPLVGEHNDEVYRGLGVDLPTLREQGIV